MYRKLLSLLLALCAALTLLPAPVLAEGASGFEQVNTYADGQFTDVSPDAWYAAGVKSAYELGLMNGVGGGRFDPEGTVTLAQAVAMAARIHSIYHTGGEDFRQGVSPWYAPYVDYARGAGILTRDCPDYDAAATRAQFASLFGRALPASALAEINSVADGAIGDVDASRAGAPEIYLLYRAGVLTGSGEDMAFRPAASIQRAEAAAVVTRMALPEQRVRFAGGTEGAWQGDAALDFTAQRTDGSSFTLSEQAGKVVLVNFWATWCGPCVREMPDIARLYDEYSGGGEVEIVLINCGESAYTVQNFLSGREYSFPVICDTNGAIMSAYGISAIPRTIIFGKDGTIAADYTGAQTGDTLQKAIEDALAG